MTKLTKVIYECDGFSFSHLSVYDIAESRDSDITVEIMVDGHRFYAWFWSISAISQRLKFHRDNFFWATDMVVVDEITPQALTKAIQSIIDENLLHSIFTEVQKDAAS